MPDIHDLLRTAARGPQGAPDLPALERRAHSLRRRQQVVRTSVVLGVVVLLVPLVRGGVSGGSHALEQEPAGRQTTSPTATATSVPRAGVTAAPATPLGSAAPAGSPAPARPGFSASRPSLSPRATASAPADPSTSPTSGFPLAPSCQVSTTTLAPGQSATCRFTATRAGGYDVTFNAGVGFVDQGSATVEVVRDGSGTSYDAYHGAGCADAVIRAGDLVTVTVQAGPGAYEDFTLAAGQGHGCGS